MTTHAFEPVDFNPVAFDPVDHNPKTWRMQIKLNGEPREVEPHSTITDLLAALALQPKLLAVERNFELVPRQQHSQCHLQAGDEIEIVTLVGGG